MSLETALPFVGSIFVVIRVPQPWPVQQLVVLSEHAVSDGRVRLLAEPGGNLTVETQRTTHSARLDRFQRLDVIGTGAILVGFSWGQHVELAVNGLELRAGNPDELSAVAVATSETTATLAPSAGDGVLPSGITHEEALLVATVGDIVGKCCQGD